jgi:hypothetical protein
MPAGFGKKRPESFLCSLGLNGYMISASGSTASTYESSWSPPNLPRRVLQTVEWLGDVYSVRVEAITVRLFEMGAALLEGDVGRGFWAWEARS